MADILLEGDINRAAKTNNEGNFSIDELPPGEYTAIANADGYEGKMSNVTSGIVVTLLSLSYYSFQVTDYNNLQG